MCGTCQLDFVLITLQCASGAALHASIDVRRHNFAAPRQVDLSACQTVSAFGFHDVAQIPLAAFNCLDTLWIGDTWRT